MSQERWWSRHVGRRHRKVAKNYNMAVDSSDDEVVLSTGEDITTLCQLQELGDIPESPAHQKGQLQVSNYSASWKKIFLCYAAIS